MFVMFVCLSARIDISEWGLPIGCIWDNMVGDPAAFLSFRKNRRSDGGLPIRCIWVHLVGGPAVGVSFLLDRRSDRGFQFGTFWVIW